MVLMGATAMGSPGHLAPEVVAVGMSPAKAWLRALASTAPISLNPTRVFPVVVKELAERFGDSLALLSERESMTYRGLAEQSNRYARWAVGQGLVKGEVVCLSMPNRPEYLAIWLGVTLAGGVVALLNTNLIGPALAHCIDIVNPKHVIVASELMDAFNATRPYLKTKAKIWVHGEGFPEFPRIDSVLERQSSDELTNEARPPVTIHDRALLIYTSGTTGLPKAANVSHYRVMLWSHWFAGMLDMSSSDRMYSCLPMYHSVGGVVAPGAVLVNGGSAAIREKFSATQFWDDIARWDCTLFQYIGELCRYLLYSAPHPREADHRIRACCGNGLRPDVWNDFKVRFRIPQVLEFYAATEGNVSIYNAEGKQGAVGRIPPFLAHRFPLALVKFDFEKELPFRDERGFCIRCTADEVGEAISRVSSDVSEFGGRFEGYTDQKETEKKILHDVFKTGDAWFRTGDLMRQDKAGFFYFVDRTGDTFRWKGENVATSEVSEVITAFPGIKEANVYGVAVPRRDGRAGMAALVVSDSVDLAAFRDHLEKALPGYAQPLFLRFCETMEVTATFKQKKAELVQSAYDPSKTNDPIYFNDPKARAFVRLDNTLYGRIQSGQVLI
jgi:fatty-acyl-CoA synthase